MMKKIISYKLIGLGLIMAGIAACDTADQDVSPVISPDGNPLATFTSSLNNDLTEGDTLTYTITTDRMIDRAITFTPHFVSGTVGESDYIALPAVLQPYSKETKLYVIAVADNYPETTVENLKMEIKVDGIAERYILKPSQTFPTFDVTITNHNDPTLLTVVLEWPDTSLDLDVFTWSNTEAHPMTLWGKDGASSANPETDMAIWLSDPVGTYYINLLEYGADGFNYKYIIGFPDQTIQIFEGVYNRADYTVDMYTPWNEPTYRMFEVQNTGTAFTVTEL